MNCFAKALRKAFEKIFSWHQQFDGKNICLVLFRWPLRHDSLIALEGPVSVIPKFRVKQPMADFMSTGKATILSLELLSYYNTSAFAVNEPGGLDRHRLGRAERGGWYVFRVFKSDTEPLLDHRAKI